MTTTDTLYAQLDAIRNCDCPPTIPFTREYRRSCIHDYADAAIRDAFIDSDESDDATAAEYAEFSMLAELLPHDNYLTIRALIRDILADSRAEYHDTALTRLSMMLITDYSLCPAHRIDYAICFDDDDPDCAQIRAFFPSHDT